MARIETANQYNHEIAGYSGTPLAQKLGIKLTSRVAAVHAPPDFDVALAEGFAPVAFDTELTADLDVIDFFATEYSAQIERREALIAALKPNGGLWIAWPKKASKVPTDIDENRLREAFLGVTPMVDNKVCAIDAVWSGLRFVRRLEFR